ncbi:protein rep [Streptomyces subrutilus]|uniref:protein rep n=1 Tax=Streptomyces subrutilus TaxID=36818 RepID=UPI002E147FC8|nr:protein rep [Streptomyces subrutilus]
MNSVSNAAAVPPQRPAAERSAGVRCHCGTALTQTPGKRRKIFCSEACKKQASRVRKAAEEAAKVPRRAGGAPPTGTKKGRGLGTTARTTDMQVSGLHSDGETDNPGTSEAKRDARFSGADAGTPMASDADTTARDGRFELRENLRGISALDRLRDCGLSVLAGGVVPVIRNGRAGYAGVVTCGSVHVCPCCSTSIRRVRQDELDQVGQFWECQSCGLVMMTLTMRHYERHLLADLAEQQRSAWRIGFGQNAGRAWRAAKKAYGVRGFVRAWEVTHGPNGWHCHYHVLLFLDRPLASSRVETLQHLAFEIWSDALGKVGALLPVEKSEKDGKPVGVKIDAPDRGESGKLARYLMKGQDGKTRWGIAAELTRQDVKQGQGGHRTPFEIARAATAPGADARDVELWREFEKTATGIRSLYWSNGLRKLLAEMGFELDERRDGDVAAEEAADGERLAMIPATTWYRHIARHKGRALALLKAAELGGVHAIQNLVESWGLVWGADVVEAEHLEPAGARLTLDETMRRIDRTTMAARANTWRLGFDQALLAEQHKAQSKTDPAELIGRVRVARASRRKADDIADALGVERREAGQLPSQWWAQYEAPEVVASARKIASPPARNAAQEEFLRRRRIATAAHAEDRAASLARFRENT